MNIVHIGKSEPRRKRKNAGEKLQVGRLSASQVGDRDGGGKDCRKEIKRSKPGSRCFSPQGAALPSSVVSKGKETALQVSSCLTISWRIWERSARTLTFWRMHTCIPLPSAIISIPAELYTPYLLLEGSWTSCALCWRSNIVSVTVKTKHSRSRFETHKWMQ